MIQANELRVGNYFDNNGIITKATPNTIRSQCKPIQINEEWLLKLGFVKDIFDEDNAWLHLKYRYLKFSSDESVNFQKVYIWINKMEIMCEYVHTFQNLYFALTGKELTLQ